MKKNILCLFVILVTSGLSAQHTISGNFTPAKDFKWLIAYELTAGSQRYVVDTAITEGYFTLAMPENASAGMYRLVYAVPQDEFYFDVLYNCEEDIEFNFNLEDGAKFITSVENKTYTAYLSEITSLEQQVTDFYQGGKTSKKEFTAIAQKLSEVQSKYEDIGEVPLAHQCIAANEPYIPDMYEPLDTYNLNKKKNYFKVIDFKNSLLQSSGFLTEKISNYVFSPFPAALMAKSDMENAIFTNLREVSKKLLDTPDTFQTAVFHDLWKTANTNGLFRVADTIFKDFLKPMASQNGQQALIDEIQLSSRLRMGAVSPEITWTENGKTASLSKLSGAAQYILIFWSSTCSHCLKELPALHAELKVYENVTILAVGLEDDQTNWEREIKNLLNFKHALAIGKWESEYAGLFGIKQTPTYFILDRDKRFVAKPADDKEVVSFLEEQNSKR